MNKLLCFISFFYFAGLKAAEPTVAPSALTFSKIGCNTVNISWTPGNGTYHLAVIREGSPVSDPPSDGTLYPGSPVFGKGAETVPGNKQYAFYSHPFFCGDFYGNFGSVGQLKMNTTYYVCVYTFNDTNNPDYLTNAAVCGNFTTNFVNLSFTVSYTDSCQNTNKIKLINQSTASFSGATYKWRFYNIPPAYDELSTDTVTYTWTKPGDKKVELFLVPKNGCSGTISKTTLIYARGKPDPRLTVSDSQCYSNGTNHYYFGEFTTSDPTPFTAFRRKWYIAGDSFQIPFPDVKGILPGTHRIMYTVYTLYNLRPTGCVDTAYLNITVLPDPKIHLGNDTCLNPGDSISICGPAGYASYIWNKIPTKNTCINVKSPSQNILSLSTGAGCKGSDTIVISNCINSVSSASGADKFKIMDLKNQWVIEPVLPAHFSAELYALSGQKIISLSPENKSLVIQKSGLKQGIYTLMIQQPGKTICIRLYLQN